MAKGKILDDLRCDICKKKLAKSQKLYETAWSGVYWCGVARCAYLIMKRECSKLRPGDPCNRE